MKLNLKIGVLTFQDGYNRGACDFYPLIRWKREFLNEGVYFRFFRSHEDKDLFNQDIVFVDHRYYRELTIIKNKYPDNDFIREFIFKLKGNSIKVALFDNGDGAGGRQWELIEDVDILVKKQIFKDKKCYTENRGVYSYMPFCESYNLNKELDQKNREYEMIYTPCPPEQLHKIKLGWNIGMIDYRMFPFSEYYPIGTSRLLNDLYKLPEMESANTERPIDSSFRGQINTKNENYSFQRNRVIELFKSDAHVDLLTGGIVSKKQYLLELKNSKTCVSPFGWGEVCYRDFEAIMSGALIIKPDMDHLKTFPDIYKKDQTYVPLQWDMSDLESTLKEVLENYENYISYIERAQEIYKKAISEPDGFISHFWSILD